MTVGTPILALFLVSLSEAMVIFVVAAAFILLSIWLHYRRRNKSK